MAKTYTKELMRELIRNGELVLLERGILTLFALQTTDEQVGKNTSFDNKHGFSKSTVKSGTYIANYLLGRSGRHLSGKFIDDARKICMHHAGQLSQVANGGYLRSLRDAKFDTWGIAKVKRND